MKQRVSRNHRNALQVKISTICFALGVTITSGAFAQSNAGPADGVWYVIDYDGGGCIPAALLMPKSSTPELFASNLRAIGNQVGVRAGRDTAGNLRFVRITVEQKAGKPKLSMFWFPSRVLCGTGQQAARAAGILPKIAGGS